MHIQLFQEIRMGRRKAENPKQTLAFRMNSEHIQTLRCLAKLKGVTQISIVEQSLAEYFVRNHQMMNRLN